MQKYLVILSSIFIKTHSINLILFGTYSEPLIIIIKLNTSFAGTASAPPIFPFLRHLQTLSCILSASRTYAFLFSGPDALHATPQVCGAPMEHLICGIARTYECILHLLLRVRSFND